MFYKNKPAYFTSNRLTGLASLLAGLSLLGACAKQAYVASPIDTEASFASVIEKAPDEAGFRSFLDENGYDTEPWPLQQWDIDTLTLSGLYFDPQLKAELAGLAIFDAETDIASQRRNPRLSVPLEHRAEDRGTPWSFGLVTQILYERKDKRLARIAQAQAKKQAARVRLQQNAWKMYIGMHRDLVAYRNASKRQELLDLQEALLQEGLELVQRRFDLGRASRFEVSSARLELQRWKLERSSQEAVTLDAFQKLSNRTGLASGKVNRDNITLESSEPGHPSFLSKLDNGSHAYLLEHYDIRAGLFEYMSFEAALKFEIEKQYPDINLSPGFVLEQGDNIWSLGAQWFLPLFHNNDGQIAKALAQREYKQRQFIALQTKLYNDLKNRYQKFQNASASWHEAKQLVKELESRQATLVRQHELGYTDRLSLVTSQLETLRARLSVLGLELARLNTLIALEEIVQIPVHSTIQFERWLDYLENSLSGNI